ncbi:MAG: hypothetical protein ACRCX8_10740 [Sarcina sp.]
MKKNIIILIIAAVLLAGVASVLVYKKIQSEPQPKKVVEVHKVVHVRKEEKKPTKPTLDYGIHFVNENDYPDFVKYKSSVLPFIESQYPTNFVVDITLTKVTLNNWQMEIFYNAKITESNYYSYTQTGLNYSCNVRKPIPISPISTYKTTDSAMNCNHYTIPAGTKYLNITANGAPHIQFLVHGSGVANSVPDVSKTLVINQPMSSNLFDSNSDSSALPYIYSIIDSEGVTENGFINANAPTVQYNLSSTQIEPVNIPVNVPANTKMYYYPSTYSNVIVATNSPMKATATEMVQISKTQHMYLVNIQGQEGWILM